MLYSFLQATRACLPRLLLSAAPAKATTVLTMTAAQSPGAASSAQQAGLSYAAALTCEPCCVSSGPAHPC